MRDWADNAGRVSPSRVAACSDAGFVPGPTHHTGASNMARGLVASGAVSFAAARRDSPVAGRAHEVFACAADACRSVLDRNPEYRKWWNAHPEAHPEFT